MNDVLTTINHTTVEALGFKHTGIASHLAPHTVRPNITEGYRLGALAVFFHSDGEVSMSLHDKPASLSLDELKTYAKSFSQ